MITSAPHTLLRLRPLLLCLAFLCAPVWCLAQVPSRVSALASEQAGQTAEAQKTWEDLAKANPSDPEPLAHLGLLESRQEHYEAAIKNYRQALALKPDYPGVQMNLGLAAFKAQQFPDAIRAFKAELDKHPGDQRLTILLGMSHYGLGDYLVAIPYLKQAAEKERQNLPLRLALAHSCLWSKQYACVLEVEKEILALNAESAEADMLAGEALDEMGDSAGAIEQFRSAVRVNPREPNAHFGLGYLLWKQSKCPDAATEFQAELQNDPSQSSARAYLGDCHVVMLQYSKAEPELLQASGESPALAMVHRDLGILYAATGRDELAVAELQKAIVLDSHDVAPHWRLAKLFQAKGKKEEARAEFAIASKMNKSADEALTQKISGGQPAQP